MKHLKMRLEKVRGWWKPGPGTVSMWDLTAAKLRVKLLTGLTYILSPVVKAMCRIQSAVLETQSQAKAIIDLHRIQKITPVKFKWKSDSRKMGFTAQTMPYSTAGSHNTAFGYTTAKIVPNNNIHFNSGRSSADPILTITNDGDVIWNGKPSEAADILIRSFQMKVEDSKGVTKSAKRRYYMLACQNLLKKAEDMEYEEFLAFLNREVYNRERKVILDALKGNEHA